MFALLETWRGFVYRDFSEKRKVYLSFFLGPRGQLDIKFSETLASIGEIYIWVTSFSTYRILGKYIYIWAIFSFARGTGLL
jgi:hypothetical protein